VAVSVVYARRRFGKFAVPMNIIIRDKDLRCTTCRRYVCLVAHENAEIDAEYQRRVDEEFLAGFITNDTPSDF
jgi:hypothetical protein